MHNQPKAHKCWATTCANLTAGRFCARCRPAVPAYDDAEMDRAYNPRGQHGRGWAPAKKRAIAAVDRWRAVHVDPHTHPAGHACA
ncbi:MAG: hypothetical protein JWM27_4753 [Gemmatimonadetes bacterium]|nr:hypothetical protein [Gemmatimonadota bacterium]